MDNILTESSTIAYKQISSTSRICITDIINNHVLFWIVSTDTVKRRENHIRNIKYL